MVKLDTVKNNNYTRLDFQNAYKNLMSSKLTRVINTYGVLGSVDFRKRNYAHIIEFLKGNKNLKVKILGNINYEYYTFVIQKRGINSKKVAIARPYDSELDTKGLIVPILGNDNKSPKASASLSFTLEPLNPPPLPIP